VNNRALIFGLLVDDFVQRVAVFGGEDLNFLATLFVNAMIVIAEAIEDAQSRPVREFRNSRCD
jgi:hypothetical protein